MTAIQNLTNIYRADAICYCTCTSL